jgi:hypothetical protein
VTGNPVHLGESTASRSPCSPRQPKADPRHSEVAEIGHDRPRGHWFRSCPAVVISGSFRVGSFGAPIGWQSSRNWRWRDGGRDGLSDHVHKNADAASVSYRPGRRPGRERTPIARRRCSPRCRWSTSSTRPRSHTLRLRRCHLAGGVPRQLQTSGASTMPELVSGLRDPSCRPYRHWAIPTRAIFRNDPHVGDGTDFANLRLRCAGLSTLTGRGRTRTGRSHVVSRRRRRPRQVAGVRAAHRRP